MMENNFRIPAITIKYAVSIDAERNVPNGTKITMARIAKATIIWK